jgi:glycosyltransferase involved in cell wall biosynthesis
MKKNFALFFTRGISLAIWDKLGSIDREIKPYIKHAEFFDRIFLFTYGVNESEKYSKLFPDNIVIVSRPKYIPVNVYSFILPFIHYKIIKDIQIIKTNQMAGSWTAVIAKKISKSRLVIRCGYEWLHYLEKLKYSWLKRKVAYLIERFAYNNADRIVITSNEGREFIKNRFKITVSRIILIPNYIDTKRFGVLNTKKEKGRIVFVGRLDPVKNLTNLILALKGLPAHLVLIGEGPLKDNLKNLASAENLKVEFMGSVSQQKIPEELNKSEIFVLPSISEGNPKVLLEAMSCGLPCLGSDIVSISEIISNNINGVLCQTDVDSIRIALENLLNNESLRKQIGDKARQTIIERFSFEKIIESESKLYEEILR